MPHGEIDLLAREVDVMVGRDDAQVDARMCFGKAAEAMHQPLCREIGRGGNCNDVGVAALGQPFGTSGDAVEGIAHNTEVIPAAAGQCQPLVLAIEQFQSERLLQRLDLMADRALRHVQFVRRAREALVACGSLERFQRI
jgi:hypothetical protein